MLSPFCYSGTIPECITKLEKLLKGLALPGPELHGNAASFAFLVSHARFTQRVSALRFVRLWDPSRSLFFMRFSTGCVSNAAAMRFVRFCGSSHSLVALRRCVALRFKHCFFVCETRLRFRMCY